MTSRGYKRSWKNLLINKRYQLRFTLFMVGLAVVLMALLGWWVVRVADDATRVAESRLRKDPCPELPMVAGVSSGVVVTSGAMTFEEVEPGTDEASGSAAGSGSGSGAGSGSDTGSGSGSGSDTGSATGSGSGSGSGSGTGVDTGSAAGSDADAAPVVTDRVGGHRITMDEPSMRLEPIPLTLPEHYVEDIQKHLQCRLARGGKIAVLDAGKRRIVLVLVLSGLAVMVGLVLFGIKMTHRVAGPLYKVTLYLAKLRDGRYDKVYDLRKGDQLREFYEHFREAHAGVVTLEKGDRARISAALDAAAADGLFVRSPEAKAAADELRAILERKEKALGDDT
jgi:hypothetical protein